MEIKNRDPNFPYGYNDGLDTELDRIGVILDKPVICGGCMRPMEAGPDGSFTCSRCGNILKIKKF